MGETSYERGKESEKWHDNGEPVGIRSWGEMIGHA